MGRDTRRRVITIWVLSSDKFNTNRDDGVRKLKTSNWWFIESDNLIVSLDHSAELFVSQDGTVVFFHSIAAIVRFLTQILCADECEMINTKILPSTIADASRILEKTDWNGTKKVWPWSDSEWTKIDHLWIFFRVGMDLVRLNRCYARPQGISFAVVLSSIGIL